MARILLVEDDEQVRGLIEDMLRDADHEVDSTATVSNGRELLDSRAYDLLLSDGRLPDGNGFMVAEKAEENGVKVLILTGYAHDFPREQLAAYTVLSKPIRMGKLLSAVNQAINP